MALTYNEIIAVIEDQLEAITDIKKIYTEAPELPDQYPCAVIRPNGHTNEMAGLRDNLREYAFSIDIIANLTDNREESQIKLRDIVDSVIDSLESYENISSTGIDWAEATSAVFRYQGEPTKLYIAEITYKLKIRFNRHG